MDGQLQWRWAERDELSTTAPALSERLQQERAEHDELPTTAPALIERLQQEQTEHDELTTTSPASRTFWIQHFGLDKLTTTTLSTRINRHW